MEYIAFENFRGIRNSGNVKISPLTVLVGKNSSGKSTFLRSFPLFKQTFEAKTNSPILWYDPNLVDFGSFKETLHLNSETNEITFKFGIKLDENSNRLRRYYFEYGALSFRNDFFNKSKELNIDVKLYISEKEKVNNEFLKKILLTFEKSTVEIHSNNNNEIEKISINNKEVTPKEKMTFHYGDGLIPSIVTKTNDYLSPVIPVEENLFEELSKFTRKGTSKDSIRQIISNISFGGKERVFEELISERNKSITLRKKMKEKGMDSSEFIEIYNNIILLSLSQTLREINSNLQTYYSNNHYIAPLRASAERYYRVQGLAVNEVDSLGRNLPMFLKSLSRKRYESFSQWTFENFNFEPVISTEGGHTSIKLKVHGEEINLADTGFGYSQILPIITQLWTMMYMSGPNKRVSKGYHGRSEEILTFIIEQPELHLHPAFQAKLIDAFLKAIKLGMEEGIKLKVIMETHSETMINRIGHHIAKKNISKDIVNLVIFDKEKYDTKIKFGEFDEKGRLRNWPFGFFYPEELKI